MNITKTSLLLREAANEVSLISGINTNEEYLKACELASRLACDYEKHEILLDILAAHILNWEHEKAEC